MRALGIPSRNNCTASRRGRADDFRNVSPSGRVPWLVDGDAVVWDSLAIAEYARAASRRLAGRDRRPRLGALRCAEMHSGFIPAARPAWHECRRGAWRWRSARRMSLADIARASSACGTKAWRALAGPSSPARAFHRRRCLLRAGGVPLPAPGWLARAVWFWRWRPRRLAYCPPGDAWLVPLGSGGAGEDFRRIALRHGLAQIGTVTADLRTRTPVR